MIDKRGSHYQAVRLRQLKCLKTRLLPFGHHPEVTLDHEITQVHLGDLFKCMLYSTKHLWVFIAIIPWIRDSHHL